MSEKWDWNDEDGKESTVVQSVQAVAVYTNVRGEIVIRQEGARGEDDSLVIFPITYAKSVVEAIMVQLDLGGE